MKKIGKFTPVPLKVGINVQYLITLHYFKYAKLFTFSGEKHDFWEMVYVDKGKIGVLAEDRQSILTYGEAIFHKPNEYHNIWAENQYANVVVLTFVCRSEAMSFFENKIMNFNDEQCWLLAKILEMGRTCFADPLDEVYQTRINLVEDLPFGAEQIIKNYVELLLISLIQHSRADTKGNQSLDAQRGDKEKIAGLLKEILAENVYTGISLTEVLKQIRFSKSYVTRLFRENAGCSIIEYFIGLKIAEAQKMISERELSFSQIAEKLSFGSVHYFSYMFKKKTGMSPTEYRKSVQSQAIL